MSQKLSHFKVHQIHDLNLIAHFRHQVLTPHKAVEDCLYPTDQQKDCFHLGVIQEGKLLAVATFFSQPLALATQSALTFRLRQMGVDPQHQGLGLGAKVLQQGIENLQKKGVQLLWCNARLKAIPFYEKMGFQCVSEVYEIDGIGPHRDMSFSF